VVAQSSWGGGKSGDAAEPAAATSCWALADGGESGRVTAFPRRA